MVGDLGHRDGHHLLRRRSLSGLEGGSGVRGRQLIVIGKHQLGDAHGIVLVDDREHVVFQHHLHAGLLILVLLLGTEILLHGQYLTYLDLVFAEKVVIETYEFHLSDGREQLALLLLIMIMVLLCRRS